MTVIHTDCLDGMRGLDAESVDAIVTDPPYGLSFMGKDWDHGVPGEAFWEEALRVAKPGAHLLAFGGTRTFHRLAVAIEDAGWEIRDCLSWLYGSGFPKSHNGPWGGTALKPAWEPILMARKPLMGTVAANVAAHGTGTLNVDGCRIETNDNLNGGAYSASRKPSESAWVRHGGTIHSSTGRPYVAPAGRWPANVALDEDAAAMLDEQSGDIPTQRIDKPCPEPTIHGHQWGTMQGNRGPRGYSDTGGASRFFYCAKASRSEREAGLEGMEAGAMYDRDPSKTSHRLQVFSEDGRPDTSTKSRNHHPTVKPIALMRWLCRLVTPQGGLILDPFTGSGTTGCAAVLEGLRFLGFERDAEYVEIARRRIAHHQTLFSVPTNQ